MSDDLQARIARLERSNRRWKVLALVFAVLFGVMAAGGLLMAERATSRAMQERARAEAARDAERQARMQAEEAAQKKR